jgi:hypothetical protein
MVEESTVRSLLQRHGVVRSQPAQDWTGSFPLPVAVEAFYSGVGPVDVNVPGYGNDYFLPSLAGLWQLQAGYRWNGKTHGALPGWDDDWLVVAYEAGDPFIFSRSSGRILHAVHGQGDWEPGELFPDLLSMAASLAIMGGVVADAGADLTDSKGYVRVVHRKRAIRELGTVLGLPAVREDVLADLGWG